ncbi:MAG: hypothetical protein AVDCRST_MAG73-1881, partial [uncultured Thermomicrobiales bacterium]
WRASPPRTRRSAPTAWRRGGTTTAFPVSPPRFTPAVGPTRSTSAATGSRRRSAPQAPGWTTSTPSGSAGSRGRPWPLPWSGRCRPSPGRAARPQTRPAP